MVGRAKSDLEQECLQETKKRIKVSETTLHDREVSFYAERGFPLDHKRLKEHADAIARARHVDNFPEAGVGKDWTARFASDHNDCIGMYWTHALDRSRARAVNAYNHEHYFDLLEEVVEGKGGDDVIPDELKYGTDESGLQRGVGLKTRAFGAKGTKVQQQQRSGDRENITVIVTICGDGTSTTPGVIYKGEGFQAKWKQDNPLNCSLGYQKKGYTNDTIGRAWIEQFDKETRANANSQRRLLLYARHYRIEVLSYPSHSTHIYQGLDVVIFSALKRNWTKVRDEWERDGNTVQKRSFLALYAKVHIMTLTSDNIKAAFRKTGVIPLDRGVVTASMMAPSLTTSVNSVLPIRQESPVWYMSDMVRDYIDYQTL
ncbi:hypothetical protein K435DRAFT_817878 [Dendrothele bispora CBS 962.96]|uniref:DDE-1 domain-containing protein n=1 Tax=Dendrothele bispora (strain CBS 962.96) TaxID=1314807 RepID=A0A4S8MI93_DENBC|nr:hypothetical protein K435DRAFT_817878 [Dendrothele bispora CBS 962.96]